MKESNYFIDTNIFLRVIAKNGKQSTKDCELLFKNIKEGTIKAITSSLVLAEINWTLKRLYKLSRKDIVKALKSVIEMKHLKIENKENAFRTLELYEKHNVKFVDAIIASRHDILNRTMPVVSYDKDFDKLKVLRKEPKDLF